MKSRNSVNNQKGDTMDWPEIDPKESFTELELRLGITEEVDDVRTMSLGAHPSRSFYSGREPAMDIEKMRTKYSKVAERY